MNILLYILFALVLFAGYFEGSVGKYLNLVPELFSGLIFLFVILKVGAQRSVSIGNKYFVLAILAGLHVVVGVLINLVAPGTLLNGLRPYVKLMPIFLLPAVLQPSERDVRNQLRFLLVLGVLQCPVAFYQRLVEYRGLPTGDVIGGTLGSNASGSLSVLLIATIAVLFSFYLAKHIRFPTFFALSISLFLPTTINETKATIFLLPAAILVPLFYARGRRFRTWQYAVAGAIAVTLIGGYAAIYDYVATQIGREQLASSVGSEKNLSRYLYQGGDQGLNVLNQKNLPNVRLPRQQLGSYGAGRRLDNLLLPLKYYLQKDAVQLWVGSGVGNTSESFFKPFSGELGPRVGESGKDMLMSLVLWDMGTGGVLLVLVFLYFVFRDAHWLARQNAAASTFAVGWLAVLAIALLTSVYVNILYVNALGYLFVYFSGYIAAERYRVSIRDVAPVPLDRTVSGIELGNRRNGGALRRSGHSQSLDGTGGNKPASPIS